jgi:hypothetical protein
MRVGPLVIMTMPSVCRNMKRINGDEISRWPTSQKLARICEKYFGW